MSESRTCTFPLTQSSLRSGAHRSRRFHCLDLPTQDLSFTFQESRTVRFSSRLALIITTLALAVPSPANAQDPFANARKLENLDGDAVLLRVGRKLVIKLENEPEDREIKIPRVFASLKSVQFLGKSPHPKLIVHPEPNEWFVRWKPDVETSKAVVLSFDSTPLLADEVKPIRQAGDGTLTLHAHHATTSGEKLRFEPQPHKNTVGYWTIAGDSATWKVDVSSPGSFNVGILQGCGSGQGGSAAMLKLTSPSGEESSLEFEVEETGHFQNFIWRGLGSADMNEKGEWSLTVMPKKIANKALMDVRMIHLSPAR